MARKVIGGMLIASPFLGIFMFSVVTTGWLATLAVFGGILGLVCVMLVGMHLLVGDQP